MKERHRNPDSRRWSDSEKRALVRRFERSKLTQRAFSEHEGVSAWTLRQWQRQFSAAKEAEGLFFEVGEKGAECFEVEYQGIRVKVPSEFRPQALELLLKTLVAAKC